MSSAPVAAYRGASIRQSVPSTAGALLPWIALAALIALQTALIVTHSPWRDELQAPMLAKYSTSLRDLFANIHYEGSPALWFLLLRAVAPFGGTPEILKAIQLVVTFSTIAIVWTRAPFGPWTRLLLLASYLILFEWGVIARSYGLGMALYFGFLALNRRPLLAFLMLGLVTNVAAHFFLLAGVSALFLFLIDDKRSWSGLALFAMLALVAVATAWPPVDVYPQATFEPSILTRLGAALETISGALMPFDPHTVPPRWQGLTLPASLLAGALVFPLGAFALLRSWVAAALFLLLCAGVFVFSFLVFPALARHAGVIFLFLIGAEWILVDRGFGPISLLARAWIAVLAACGLWIGGWALFVPFSGMRDVARSIEARGLEDAQWAVYPSFIGVELSARLNHPYFDVQRQCLAWFQNWNAAFIKGVKAPELDARLAAAAASTGGRMYFLAEQDYGLNAPHLTLIETFAPGLFPEPLRIYEVTAPPESVGAPLPFCN